MTASAGCSAWSVICLESNGSSQLIPGSLFALFAVLTHRFMVVAVLLHHSQWSLVHWPDMPWSCAFVLTDLTFQNSVFPDEVRNFVTELAHLAYSRGVPAGPIPTPAAAGDPTLPTPPSSSGHVMQQAVVNLPPHLMPGHPSFDQHAYQLLLQQQHHQAAQMSLQQQQSGQHHQQHQHQHQHASVQSDLHGDMEDDVRTSHNGQDPESEHVSEGQHDMHGDGLDLESTAH